MEDLASAAGYIAAVIALAASAVVLVHRRRHTPRTAIRRYLAASLINLGVASAVATPATLALTRPWDVLPNLVHVVGDVFAVAAVFCVLAMLTHAVGRPDQVHRRVRGQAVILAATVVAMIVLLVCSGAHATLEFARTCALDPYVVGYELLYLVAMVWGMVNFLWLIRRYLAAGDLRLRTVLRTVLLAAAVGLVWAVGRVFDLVALHVGLRLPVDQAAVSELLAAVLVTLLGVGCTAPAWSLWLARSVHQVWTRRHFTALGRLWRTLTTAVPHAALHAAGPATPEFALYRRVIEIRDAQLVLRKFVPPDIADRARVAAHRHSVPVGRHTALLVEATELAAALRVHQLHQSHTDIPDARIETSADAIETTAVHETDTSPPTPTGAIGISDPEHEEPCRLSAVPTAVAPADVRTEVRELITISRFLFTSPIVMDLVGAGATDSQSAMTGN